MASNSVEFHPAASQEVEAAFLWYLARSERAAVLFQHEVERAVKLISVAPERFPVGPHGARKCLLHRFPFAVIYRVLPSTIQILAVAHGRRRPGYWKMRG